MYILVTQSESLELIKMKIKTIVSLLSVSLVADQSQAAIVTQSNIPIDAITAAVDKLSNALHELKPNAKEDGQ